ncbi:MAG: carboxypeptidase regulatory-like domain-containing protein [Nocardioidaceae bacterium]|nr:carboxypeptidase regulatory-like domain-containing protein [Nocardioidaceae bacterium]
MTRLGTRTTGVLAAAVLPTALLAGGLAAVPAAAATPQLTVSPLESSTFSPNGDGNEDTLTLEICPDPLAPVTVEVLDGTAAVIRTLAPTGTPEEAGDCYGATWDGKNQAGTVVPDADYTVRARTQSATAPLEQTLAVHVDTRVPGTLTRPTAGSLVDGTTTFVLHPAAGFTIDAVGFGVGPGESEWVCSEDGVLQAGDWRADLNTSSCGEGALHAGAEVSWTDVRGESHSYLTSVAVHAPARPLRAVIVSTPVAFSPDGDGYDETAELSFCAVSANAGTATASVEIVDAHGGSVRQLPDEKIGTTQYCSPWYGGDDGYAEWDGRDDQGHVAPEGRYQAVLTVDDPVDPPSEARLDLAIDNRAPGAIVAPGPGQTLVSGTPVVLRPTAGLQVQEVMFSVYGGDESCDLDGTTQPDGTWSATPTEPECPITAGSYLMAGVRWLDVLGGEHWRTLGPAGVETGISYDGARVFSPDGDGNDDSLSGSWCAVDPTSSWLDRRVRILDATGTVVYAQNDDTSGPDAPRSVAEHECLGSVAWDGTDGDGTPVPDGRYTLRLSASGDTTSFTKSLEIVVDRRAAGRITTPGTDQPFALGDEVVYAPTAGFTTTSVDIVVQNAAGDEVCVVDAPAGPDGTWRGTPSAAVCPGTGADLSVRARARWTDEFGLAHVALSRRAGVSAHVSVNGPQEFSPDGDGYEDVLAPAWCVFTPGSDAAVQVTARVLDAGGDVVAVIADGSRDPDVTDAEWYGACPGTTWDGTDENGEHVGDGDYTLEVVARLGDGSELSSTRPIAVRRSAPGYLQAPYDGAHLPDQVHLVFTPYDGTDLDSVHALVGDFGSACQVESDADIAYDGSAVADLDVSACSGTVTLHVTVEWRDRFGQLHEPYSPPPLRWTVGRPTVGISASDYQISPDGDGVQDTVTLSVCVDDPALVVAQRFVRLRVLSGQEVVRELFAGNVTPTQAWQPWYGCALDITWDGRDADGVALSPGTYVLEAALEDGDLRYAVTTTGVTVVDGSDVPGHFVSPATGDQPATFDVDFAPDGTREITDVWAQGACYYGDAPTADPDGHYRIHVDAATCPGSPEVIDLSLQVNWVDESGFSRTYQEVRKIRVRLAPVAVTPYVSQALVQPRAPYDFYRTTTIRPCAVDSADGGALSARIRILAAGGTAVRTFEPVQVTPQSYAYYCANDPSAGQVTWDGRDAGGAVVLDGSYTVEVTLTDAGGLSDTVTAPVQVAGDEPGAVVEPAAGATVLRAAQFGFKPAVGATVSSVSFRLDPLSGVDGCSSATVYAADLDGVFRAPLDTVNAGCGDGPRNVRALVSWQDAQHRFRFSLTSPVPVTLANPVVAPVVTLGTQNRRTFSPNGDGSEDTVPVQYRVADATAGDLVRVRVEVLDTAGAVVRTLVDEDRRAGSFFSTSEWDGKDAGGAPAPEGQYRFRVTATDGDGLADTKTSVVVVLDRRVPVEVTPVFDGQHVAAPVDVVLTPLAGIDVRSARVDLLATRDTATTSTCSLVLTKDAASDAWRGTLPVASCGVGRRTVQVSVGWYDSFSLAHSYYVPRGTLVLDPGTPQVSFPGYVARSFSPGGEDFEDDIDLDSCVLGDGVARVTQTITDAAGALVRSLDVAQRDLAPTCPSPWYGGDGMTWDGRDNRGVPVPDGLYHFVVTATAPGGASDTGQVDLAVDRRMPGTPVAPARATTLAGAAEFEFAPTAGLALTQVVAVLGTSADSATLTLDHPDPVDGQWRGTIPVGDLTSGAAAVSWSATWKDRFGTEHWYGFRPVPVLVDSVNPPLTLTPIAVSGRAPFTARLSATTSDTQDRDVTITVDWGDGSLVETTTVSSPYATLPLSHVYDHTGSYTSTHYALVTASIDGGGQTSRQLRITVAPHETTPPPGNTAPTVQVSTDPVSGTAPLDVTTSLAATDPDGDTLHYNVNFGDGTAAVTGTLPTEPVTHRYQAGGTYLVRTAIDDGRATVVRFATVTVALDEPLAAHAGDDLVVQKGDRVVLDASASRPQAGISRYSWDFGDGSTHVDAVTATHTYAAAGTYHARLTVYAGAATESDEVVVTVLDPQPADGGLAVEVRTGSGAVIPGADLFVQLPDGQRASAVSGADGVGRLFGLPDGFQTVYVAKPGYLPRKVSANVSAGAGEAVVVLESGNVASAVLTSERLTPDQVEAAGIDTDDPANQQVVQFSVRLLVNGTSTTMSGYHATGSGGSTFAMCPSFDGVTPDCPQHEDVACTTLDNGYQACARPIAADGQPGLAWMIVPATATWLKEYFQVTMQVTNLAGDAAFRFSHGQATLNVPAGMSLPATASHQSLTMPVADVPAGGSSAVSWIVRGDTAGSYDLTASYAGTLEPTGTPVSVTAKLAKPLKVWGASAITLSVDVDDTAYGMWDQRDNPFQEWVGAYPYHATITVKNVADVPVYNLDVALTAQGRENFVLQPLSPESLGTDRLDPGQTISRDFILVPKVSGALDLSSSFVSRSAGEDAPGATVTAHPRAVPTSEVPQFEALKGAHGKALLTFDEVPGATAYRFFTRSGLEGDYREVPADDVHQYYVAGTGPSTPGPKRVVLQGIDPEVDRYFVISSVIGGKPTMVHRLAPLPETENKPAATPVYHTSNGGPHTCGARTIDVTFDFGDDFGLQSWTVDPDGDGEVARDVVGQVPADSDYARVMFGEAGARTTLAVPLVLRIPAGQSSMTVRYWAYNLAGDGNESQPWTLTVDTECPRRDVAVVAMGLNSSLDTSQALASDPAPSSCPVAGRDAFSNQAATNACVEKYYGDPTDTQGNVIAYLNAKGYYQGASRSAGGKDLIEFSYEGADVNCYASGGPAITPRSYSGGRTWTEIITHVSRKDTDTADRFLDALEDYAACWKQERGEQLYFNFFGHSLGGYEVLAMANGARKRTGSIKVASVTTIDGAIHPSIVWSELMGGHCKVDGDDHPIWAGLGDAAGKVLQVGVFPTSINVALGYDAIFNEKERVGHEIDELEKTGARVATVTNLADECLFADGTVSDHAEIHTVYNVDAPGWKGEDGHSALLTSHKSPVDAPGYPVTGTVDWALNGHRGGGVPRAIQGFRAAMRVVGLLTTGSAEADPTVTGRVVDPGTGDPLAGTHVVLSGDVQLETNTGADGTFTVPAVPPGSYRVHLTPQQDGLRDAWVGGADRDSAQVFDVGADTDLGDLSPGVARHTSIRVVDAGGAAVAGSGVVVTDAAGHQVAVVRTGDDGSVVVDTGAGAFDVVAAKDATASPSVPFTAGGDEVVLHLAPIARVSATLADAAGDPVPNALAGLYDESGALVGSAATDALGQVTFVVAPGTSYVVRFVDVADRFAGEPETPPVTPVPGDAESGTAAVTLGAPPTLGVGVPPGTLVVGDAVDFTFTATATGTARFAVASGALPPGLVLGEAGHLTGAPTAPGSFTFHVKVTDDNGSATGDAITVVVRSRPTVPAGTPPATGKVGTALAPTTFTSTGSPAPVFGLVGALPDGVTLTEAGLLAGTPTAAGTFSYYVTATNPAGTATAGPFVLTVTSGDGPSDPATPPGTPTQVAAGGTSGGAAVTWAPPVSDGGAAITGYVVVPILAGVRQQPVETGPDARRQAFPGLVAGAGYRFAVAARNAQGVGTEALTGTVVVVAPTRLLLTQAPSVATFGKPITVAGRLTRADTGASLGGVLVALQYRKAGSTAPFRTGASARTLPTGVVSVTGFRPRTAVEVRLAVAGGNGLLGSVSAARRIACQRAVTVALSSRTVAVGRSVRLSGTVRPVASGRRAVIQYWTGFGWRTITTKRIDATGRFSTLVRGSSRGPLSLRVVVAASGGYVRSVSRTVPLTVR